MIRKIDEGFAVSPQIGIDDVAQLAHAGFCAIINNRPDGEDAGQPAGEAICQGAQTNGLSYAAIPVTHTGFSHPQLDAMAAALADAGGPVLAYCRSGTRSCNLWALAMAKQGANPDTLCAKAAAAGYDLSGIRAMLDALAGAVATGAGAQGA